MARQLKLYIASSLDGYIARPDDSLDWLEGIPNPEKLDFGYNAFIEGIDTVIMGRKTYEQVLGFDVDWPYGGYDTYVLSSNPELPTPTPRTQLVSGALRTFSEALQQKPGKDIWVVGGGAVITAFLNEGLIDEMILSKVSVILGTGIPLFPNSPQETALELVEATAYGKHIVNLTYRRA